MALQPTRMEFRLTLSHVDRGVETTETVVFARHPSETMERVVLRILAWCLLHEPGLELGDALADPDAPDLSARDLTGRVTTWIRCGAIAADRLKKIVQHNSGTAVSVVLADERREQELLGELAGWKRQGDLTIWGIDPALVAALASSEERRQRWTVTIVEDHIYVDADGRTTDGAAARRQRS